MLAEPYFELLRGEDPDACPRFLTRVAALEHTAEDGRIIGQKGRLQHILAVLQFQIVMVGDASARIGSIVYLLVDQHAGLEFRQRPVLTITADGCPQRFIQKSCSVLFSPAGQHYRQGDQQPAFLRAFHRCNGRGIGSQR